MQQLFYKLEHDTTILTTDAGTNIIRIRPPFDEVWLMDHVTISQDDILDRVFSFAYITGSILMALIEEGHLTIRKGGAAVEQPIYPSWVDEVGGAGHYHPTGIRPLQLDNDNYLQIKPAVIGINKQIRVKYRYRRVI